MNQSKICNFPVIKEGQLIEIQIRGRYFTWTVEFTGWDNSDRGSFLLGTRISPEENVAVRINSLFITSINGIPFELAA